MISRILTPIAFTDKWGRQMRFIAGPRQCGKTTIAKAHLQNKSDSSFYYNWDQTEIKKQHHRGIDFVKRDVFTKRDKKLHWVCFDEIHKMPKWKNILKSYFDTYEDRVRFIVTGSARLDLFHRSGDSLVGRYFLFHLLPLNLFELTKKAKVRLQPYSSPEDFVTSRLASAEKSSQETMEALLNYSGFPEPFTRGDSEFLKLWQQENLDRLIKEDLRDLTRIPDLENVVSLTLLLPDRIGSPLSINSLTGDLMVNHKTVKNYLQALELCYLLFELAPFEKRIHRTLTKERKVYFFDWTRLDHLGKRFENYAAAELFGWVSLWNDSGLGRFELRYVKTRSGQECDFLIVKDGIPWLLLEAKLKDQPLPSHFYHFSEKLGKIPIVQLVHEAGVLHVDRYNGYRVSASRFLSA